MDYQLQQLLTTAGAQQNYFRFQPELSQDVTRMDDASAGNLKRVIDLTQDYLTHPDTQDALDRVCDKLTADANPPPPPSAAVAPTPA